MVPLWPLTWLSISWMWPLAEAPGCRHLDRDLIEIAALAGGIGDRVERAQHDLFVSIEAGIDRIDRNQRRQHRRRGPGGDEIADRHLDLADPAVDGRAHLGVVEIELCGLQRRFGRLHIGDGFAIGVVALVVVAPGDHGIADQLRAALELAWVKTTRALAASSCAWALSTSAA